MKRKKCIISSLVLCVLAIVTGPRLSLFAQARDPIIGTWALNVAKSTIVKRPPLKGSLRTYDYTRDGLILVTLANVNAKGDQSFLHYYMVSDGKEDVYSKEYPQFNRARGAEPTVPLATKTIDTHTRELMGKRVEGGVTRIIDWIVFKVSPDGKILTVTYKDEKGELTGDVFVYDKQF